MTLSYVPEPGEFFVVRTAGWAGRGIRIVTDSDVNHAGTLLDTDGTTLEAQPGGAVYGHISAYPHALWSGINPDLRLSKVEAAAVIEAAHAHHGDRYSWFDCACIGLAKLTGENVPPVVRDRLEDPHMNMCSQLADVIRSDAGIHLFSDGRLPGNVSPGDLRNLITATP
jgi:hypothetical protein